MRYGLTTLLCILSTQGFTATYNGPSDLKQYAQPKEVVCKGIPTYPKGANLTFGADSVGNLQDGFSYAHTEGQVGILYFQYMTQAAKNQLKGEVTVIDPLNDFKVSAKAAPVQCKVKSWY